MTIFLKNEGFRVEHVKSPSGDVILAYGCHHNDQDRYFYDYKKFSGCNKVRKIFTFMSLIRRVGWV